MKIRANYFLLSILLSVGTSVAAAQEYTVTRDFEREWKVFQNDKYEPFQKVGRSRSIFFTVEVGKYRNDYLFLESFV